MLLKNNALVTNPALVRFPINHIMWDAFIKALNSAEPYYINGGVFWFSGTGSPEGAITAPVGSLYSRTNGGAGTSFYVKESGTGNTGWVAK